jgi:hypothetical protein
MVKEKMVDLKIKVPARWSNFIDEYCQVTGRDRDEELMIMLRTQIEMPMLEDDRLSRVDRVRLHDKYQLSDISKLPQWLRDEIAGIPRDVLANPKDAFVIKLTSLLMKNPTFKEAQDRHFKEAVMEGIDALTPDERVELQAADTIA